MRWFPLPLLLLLILLLSGGSSLTIAQEKNNATPAANAEPASEAATPRAPGFFEILFSGGILGIIIMLALIGTSLTAAYLVFDNILTLRKAELMPPQLAEEVRSALTAGQTPQAQAACQARPSLLAFVLNHGLGEVEAGWSEVEKALEDSLAEQAARLYRKVEYLSVLGSIAPMLGLLGTVTGMLLAFQTVALKPGAGSAELASGIYQALVTTVVGLIIAIPSLGAFALLRNRVDQLVAEAAYLVQHAFAPLKKRGSLPLAGAIPAPPPPPKRG